MESKASVASIRGKLTSADDRQHQLPIHYAFDYLYGGIEFLQRPQLRLNSLLSSQGFRNLSKPRADAGSKAVQRNDHAIDIYPLAAGLPWPCGILSCRQSKHWRVSLDTTREFLKQFAASDSEGVISKSGNSISELSRKELALNVEEGWAKFPIYLFSEGDEQRTKLLAAVNVFIFLFDDFWEMHDITTFSRVQEVFVARMRPGGKYIGGSKSSLQSLIDHTIAEILQLDQHHENDSGKTMIDVMVRFFNRPPPPEKYNSLEEFLLYRHEDAAVPYVLGCTKFSLNSCVDLESPRLAKYIRLLKDHVSIANDLGSWDKEKKAYDTGKVLYLINAVDVVKNLFSLPTFDAAIAMTQALQFQIECEIDAEIQQLMEGNVLTADEWEFIGATLHVMSGNVLVSTIMSRYGGEGCRLRPGVKDGLVTKIAKVAQSIIGMVRRAVNRLCRA